MLWKCHFYQNVTFCFLKNKEHLIFFYGGAHECSFFKNKKTKQNKSRFLPLLELFCGNQLQAHGASVCPSVSFIASINFILLKCFWVCRLHDALHTFSFGQTDNPITPYGFRQRSMEYLLFRIYLKPVAAVPTAGGSIKVVVVGSHSPRPTVNQQKHWLHCSTVCFPLVRALPPSSSFSPFPGRLDQRNTH